jgi:hypothetical protein
MHIYLKDAGAGGLLVRGGGAEVEGAGDVGGAALVLPAAVHEQHACVVDRLAGLWLRPASPLTCHALCRQYTCMWTYI